MHFSPTHILSFAVLDLICRRDFTDDDSEKTSTSSSERYRTATPPLDFHPRRNMIHVDILLEKGAKPMPIPIIPLSGTSETVSIHLSSESDITLKRPAHSTGACSRLEGLERTVQFTSSYPLLLQTIFAVFVDGHDAPVHSEISPMRCQSSPIESSRWTYSSPLVPGFWDHMKSHSGFSFPVTTLYDADWKILQDLKKLTIQQKIIPLQPVQLTSRSSHPPDDHRDTSDDTTITIMYRFDFPETISSPDWLYSTQNNLFCRPWNKVTSYLK